MRRHIVITLALGAALVGGCTTAKKRRPTIFIPPAPLTPRLQLLHTFTTEADLVGSSQSVSKALLGKKEEATRSLKKPYGVTSRGAKLYIADVGLGGVVTVDMASGKFDRLSGDEGKGKLKVPINLAFDTEGNLYVTDTGHREVRIYAPDGSHKENIGAEQVSKDKKFKPSGVAVYGDELYVSDLQSHQILVLNRRTKNELRRIGGPGKEKGETSFPTNIAVDDDANIYVAESLTGRVQKFSPEV
jgi:DNA-binding beta-propeller fold protein YncE